jgi:hypothetical protein
MSECLNWQEAYEAGVAACGSKGYNLARGGVLPAGCPLSAIPPALDRWGLSHSKVAMRGSATAEDSAPLFLRAVMETGGFLSHGAIVAREYGIPAVSNVRGILEALQDGETIAVNGSTGRVARGAP